MSKEETTKSFNQAEALNVLLIGLLAGFAGGFLIRSYDPQPEFKEVDQKYTTSFEEENETSEDEGKWSLIPLEDQGDEGGFTEGFEYKKEW